MAITGLKLRCALAECEAFSVAAPGGGSTAGQMAKVNDTVGIYAETQDAGDTVAFITKAPKVLVPCVATPSGSGLAAGAKVYFSASGAEVTETSGGNTLCGHALEAPSTGDEELLINLDGTLGIVS